MCRQHRRYYSPPAIEFHWQADPHATQPTATPTSWSMDPLEAQRRQTIIDDGKNLRRHLARAPWNCNNGRKMQLQRLVLLCKRETHLGPTPQCPKAPQTKTNVEQRNRRTRCTNLPELVLVRSSRFSPVSLAKYLPPQLIQRFTLSQFPFRTPTRI